MTEATAPTFQKQAYRVDEFVQAHGISRTKFYTEVNTGRLRIVRCGGRTLILQEDAKAWRDSLPASSPRPADRP